MWHGVILQTNISHIGHMYLYCRLCTYTTQIYTYCYTTGIIWYLLVSKHKMTTIIPPGYLEWANLPALWLFIYLKYFTISRCSFLKPWLYTPLDHHCLKLWLISWLSANLQIIWSICISGHDLWQLTWVRVHGPTWLFRHRVCVPVWPAKGKWWQTNFSHLSLPDQSGKRKYQLEYLIHLCRLGCAWSFGKSVSTAYTEHDNFAI